MKAKDNPGSATPLAPLTSMMVETDFEESLPVVSGLSILRGSLNKISPDPKGTFLIKIQFPFSAALVQLIPITKGGGPCTLDSVKSEITANGVTVKYDVSDASQLVQIAYLVFVT